MTLQSELDAVLVEIGTDIKEVKKDIGNTENLDTVEKTSLVGAVNELEAKNVDFLQSYMDIINS